MLFDKTKKDCLAKKDKSNKQDIDKGIKPLVNFLNKHKDYYTTSSCSGRILLMEKKTEKKKDTRFVFAEHRKANFKAIKNSLKKLPKNDIWFKQESIIIHVCCKNLEAAKRLLKIVRDSGIKRAGVISIGKRIVLEIIGTEAMETIIAKNGKLLVDDNYLKILIEEANNKLKKNKNRMKELSKKVISFLML